MVEHPGFNAVMYIDNDTVPMVKYRRVDGILEELQQDGHIDNCPKYGVGSGKVFGFFHSCYLLMFIIIFGTIRV